MSARVKPWLEELEYKLSAVASDPRFTSDEEFIDDKVDPGMPLLAQDNGEGIEIVDGSHRAINAVLRGSDNFANLMRCRIGWPHFATCTTKPSGLTGIPTSETGYDKGWRRCRAHHHLENPVGRLQNHGRPRGCRVGPWGYVLRRALTIGQKANWGQETQSLTRLCATSLC